MALTAQEIREREEFLNQREMRVFEAMETEELADYLNYEKGEPIYEWTDIKDISNESFNAYAVYGNRYYLGRIERHPDGRDIVYNREEIVFYMEAGMVMDNKYGSRNGDRVIRFSPKYRETYGSNIREKIITDDYIEKVMVNGECVRESFI